MKNNLPKRFFKKSKPGSEVTILKPKQSQFPRISLVFPEKVSGSIFISPVFITAFTLGFLIMAIGIVGNDLKNNVIKLNGVNRERLVVEAQVSEWQRIMNSYKNYKDGYYMLSLLEYKLGNYQQSFDHIQKALAIDPNYKDAKILLERISDGK